MKIHAFDHTLEIGQPYEWLEPVIHDSIVVWTGNDIQVSLWVPAGDGLREYKTWIKDDPDGWDKHRAEQARLYGQEPPPSVLAPEMKTRRWVRIPYREDDGEWQETKAETDSRDFRRLAEEFAFRWASRHNPQR